MWIHGDSGHVREARESTIAAPLIALVAPLSIVATEVLIPEPDQSIVTPRGHVQAPIHQFITAFQRLSASDLSRIKTGVTGIGTVATAGPSCRNTRTRCRSWFSTR